MALTDAKVKAAKVPEGKAQSKLSDGGGLFLLVKPSGKYWKLKYRFIGKEKSLSIGTTQRYRSSKPEKPVMWLRNSYLMI